MKIKKQTLINIALFFLVIGITSYAFYLVIEDANRVPNPSGSVGYENEEAGLSQYLAQCLADKGVKYYYLDTCVHCQEQKRLFNGTHIYLNADECSDGSCPVWVNAVPAWEFPDGTHEFGVKSLLYLAEKGGCN